MSTPVDPTLLDAYEQQVRATVDRRASKAWQPFHDGRVLRYRTSRRGLVFTDGLRDLSDAEVLGHVTSAAAFFARHDEEFEWKVFEEDHPALARALQEQGLVPDPTETILAASTSSLDTANRPLPPGVQVRQAQSREDLDGLADLQSSVYDTDWSWIAEDLSARLRATPGDVSIWIAEAADEVISAAWLTRTPGTGFAVLMGGATRPRWRGRGIYRALVASRVAAAAAWGADYLSVDASESSRPILESVGMQPLTRSTRWVKHREE